MRDDNQFKRKTYQVSQQAILLALINKHFSIALMLPKKRAITGRQFLCVKTIKNGNDVIEIDNFVHQRMKEYNNYATSIGIPMKTITRRGENNRIVENIHILLDILVELGYHFQTKVSTGKNYSLKFDTIKSFQLGKFSFNKNTIGQKGILINSYLNNLIATNNNRGQTVIVEKNDVNIEKFLLTGF
ncbi:hypothetical protein EIN_340790 [Entamoeba invadens IP1]|uniref:Uncharacterized protein n=1 Tax=Entamoeba invadens IP1 TaxID=370355 RepID=A0A0A1UH57_ENTIV|nr:hypothetical protein EIN_340790 [Entamoeba invadens IP1]ELP94741.1 hypothetical protein EIN_340790 [Entamoeba invadens IP1]|eukprot:XP_004261512.1 hypothetical protein EIN_340790 [Entamoeba invadens IP1]